MGAGCHKLGLWLQGYFYYYTWEERAFVKHKYFTNMKEAAPRTKHAILLGEAPLVQSIVARLVHYCNVSMLSTFTGERIDCWPEVPKDLRPSSFQPWISPVFHFMKLSDFITNLIAILLEASLCGWHFFPLPVLKSTLNNGPWSYPFLHSSDLQYHSNIQRRAERVSSPGYRGDWSRHGRILGSGDSLCRTFPMKRPWNQNWERGGEKSYKMLKIWLGKL